MDTKTDTRSWAQEEAAGATKADAGLVLLYAPSLDQLPSAVALPDAGLVIGRSAQAGLRIQHSAVSQLHTRIHRDEGGWAFKDMGSRNGTLVNGRRCSEGRLLPSDQLRIGDAIFKFVPADIDEYARYRIDGTGPHIDPLVIGGHRVQSALREIASIAATSLSVVIHGETGTGKELFARAVHRLSGRRGQLVALNCAAIPANLVESELFGFKRGAFTGADRDKPGLIRMADHGTLFLDEIGDMPLDSQAKLLRVLEARELLPVGATTGEAFDVRFVCATHHDLHALTAAGRFRGDLHARLQACLVRLPPLRERKEDLHAMVRHFLRLAGAPDTELRTSFVAGALQWDWPYNVRELEAAVRRAVALARGEALSVEHLPDALRENMREYGSPVVAARGAAPAPAELRSLLDRHGGNVAAVARQLGCDRAQVHRWMRYAGIDPNDHRG